MAMPRENLITLSFGLSLLYRTPDEMIQNFIQFNQEATDPPRISDAFDMISKLAYHGDPGFVILVANE